jgi:hypothetical protein
VLTNCRLLDTRTGQISSFGHSVVIKQGRIEAVDLQLPPQGAVVINCSGLVLMPGENHIVAAACSIMMMTWVCGCSSSCQAAITYQCYCDTALQLCSYSRVCVHPCYSSAVLDARKLLQP